MTANAVNETNARFFLTYVPKRSSIKMPDRSSMSFGIGGEESMNTSKYMASELSRAEQLWGPLSTAAVDSLASLIRTHKLSPMRGDLLYLNNRWYVTHAGLLRLSNRRGCAGITVLPVRAFCDAKSDRWAFRATVFKSKSCRGFVGYGDADPSNVSELVHGAEMRVAETRAVNRALRKAYGIGICSVEEIGPSTNQQVASATSKLPPQRSDGSYGGPKVRDRLCQLIRKHNLDAALVKFYATDFCGVKNLREATRDQVETFVGELAERAEKDRAGLVCQLNSYVRPASTEGAA